MSNWWIVEGNINYLQGDPNDPTNPVRLPDEYIIDFLRNIPQARSDFNLAVPDLTQGERDRLFGLIEANPFLNFLQPDRQKINDDFQKRLNTQGIYTTGPKGGRRIG